MRPPDLGQEGRAGVDDRVAAGGLPPLADHGGADLAEAALPADRLPGDQLLLGAQGRRSGRSRWTRSTPRSARPTTSSASRSASRRSWPASRSTTCSTASRSRPPSGEARRARHHLLLDLRGDPRASRAGAQVSGLGRAAGRQLLRGAELGRVLRRQLRLRAQGRALPDGAVDLLPDQRRRAPASSSAR